MSSSQTPKTCTPSTDSAMTAASSRMRRWRMLKACLTRLQRHNIRTTRTTNRPCRTTSNRKRLPCQNRHGTNKYSKRQTKVFLLLYSTRTASSLRRSRAPSGNRKYPAKKPWIQTMPKTWTVAMAAHIQGSSRTARDTAEGSEYIQMVPATKAIGKTVKPTDKAGSNVQTDMYTTEAGSMIRCMDVAH